MAVHRSSIGAVIQALNTVEPDSLTANSPYSHIHYMEEHMHAVSKVYPTLAAGVTVTGAAGAWALGNLVEIVPDSTITSLFDIHFISIEDISANGVYELVLYCGAGDTECGRVRFVQNAVQDSVVAVPFMSQQIAANDRIRAAVASSSGGADTVDIAVFYHTY